MILRQFRLYDAIPALYGLIAAVLCAIYVFLIPPFQVPDEIQHYYYASAVSLGHVFPAPLPDEDAGGLVPRQHADLAVIYNDLPFHPERKVSAAMTAHAAALRYDGTAVPASYRAAAIYAPVAYLVSGAGLAIARGLGATPLQAFYVGRAFNAALCIVSFVAALWLVPLARVFMSAVLLIPMLLSQVASYSSDAVTFALTALIVALLCRLNRTERGGPASLPLLKLSAVAVGLAAAVKTPLLVLLIAVAAVGWSKARGREVGGAVILALAPVVVWFAIKPQVLLMEPDYISAHRLDPQAQMLFLLQHPLAIVHIAGATLSTHAAQYAESVLGVFGWFDTPVDRTFYVVMLIALATAAVASLFDDRMPSRALRQSLLAAIVAYCAGVFAALYLYATGVGEAVVFGVQGRYFLPALMMLAPALPALRARAIAHYVIFPVMAIEVWGAWKSFGAIALRFYG